MSARSHMARWYSVSAVSAAAATMDPTGSDTATEWLESTDASSPTAPPAPEAPASLHGFAQHPQNWLPWKVKLLGPMEDLKQIFSDLIRYETELWNAIDARLRAEHDLPLHKFEPMQVIARTPNCRVYDIAGALSLTTGGVSKLVDSIEVSGYCRRRPNPADRRSSIIELSPVGKKVLADAGKTFERELESRMALETRALTQFASSLRALRAASAAVDESDAA